MKRKTKTCWFRGEWTKQDGTETYGCIYHNEPNSLAFRDECPFKDEEVEKCKKFEEYR